MSALVLAEFALTYAVDAIFQRKNFPPIARVVSSDIVVMSMMSVLGKCLVLRRARDALVSSKVTGCLVMRPERSRALYSCAFGVSRLQCVLLRPGWTVGSGDREACRARRMRVRIGMRRVPTGLVRERG
jgi:hypothetical protein